MNSQRLKTVRVHGMTLIEILIVVTLLGLLAGVLVKSLGGSLEAGREATAKLFITNTVKNSIESYKLVNRRYPSTPEEVIHYLPEKTLPDTPWGGKYTIEVDVNQKLHKDKYTVSYQNSHGNTVSMNVYTGDTTTNVDNQLISD